MHCHALPCIAGDNVVQYDEFKELWTFLGQEEPVLQRTAAAFAAANDSSIAAGVLVRWPGRNLGSGPEAVRGGPPAPPSNSLRARCSLMGIF